MIAKTPDISHLHGGFQVIPQLQSNHLLMFSQFVVTTIFPVLLTPQISSESMGDMTHASKLLFVFMNDYWVLCPMTGAKLNQIRLNLLSRMTEKFPWVL